jgi:UDP-hydrolysing UDP-N-acetyl-D-glucosamine 2-epimerase
MPDSSSVVRLPQTKKIVFFVGSRANYASIRSVIQGAIARPTEFLVQVVTFASANEDKFGDIRGEMAKDGVPIDRSISSLTSTSGLGSMTRTTAMSMLEIASFLEERRPDMAVVVGDRYEVLGAAAASVFANVPLIHTMGGEVSGTIDESVRHAISKLAHVHFPATSLALERLLQMGEDSRLVRNFGCPRIDFVKSALDEDGSNDEQVINALGVGSVLRLNEPYIVVSQHPVTTEYSSASHQIDLTLEALSIVRLPALILWPNSDAGSDEVSSRIRAWRERNSGVHVRLVKNLSPEVYARVLSKSACLVGNSSSGIREGAYIGVPVVNIGTRQSNRERAENVIDVPYDSQRIAEAILHQVNKGRRNPSTLYGTGFAAEMILDFLAQLEEVELQKKFLWVCNSRARESVEGNMSSA